MTKIARPPSSAAIRSPAGERQTDEDTAWQASSYPQRNANLPGRNLGIQDLISFIHGLPDKARKEAGIQVVCALRAVHALEVRKSSALPC
jgi:hypothetical protein